MIFQHTWKKILSGEKTATSRLVKPSHEEFPFQVVTGQMNSIGGASIEPGDGIEMVVDHDIQHTVYQVGKDYAVQPGRGQKSVGRICITGITRYDVRTITEEQAHMEGFSDPIRFLGKWCVMHDIYHYARWASDFEVAIPAKYDDTMQRLCKRPTAFYDAWFLTFETLK